MVPAAPLAARSDPLNLESNTEGGTEKMLADVTEFLKAYDKLN